MSSHVIAYVDGQCPVCVAGVDWVRRFDRSGAVLFVDLHEPDWAARAAGRFSTEDLKTEMRVHMPDGTWRTGYFAWAAILDQLPALRIVGQLMTLPILYGIGPATYRWIADHRQLVSRILHLPPPCDENGVCRLNRE